MCNSFLFMYLYRRYDLSKRSTFRSSPTATASAPDYHSGYNSSEEYDGSRWPYLDLEVGQTRVNNVRFLSLKIHECFFEGSVVSFFSCVSERASV